MFIYAFRLIRVLFFIKQIQAENITEPDGTMIAVKDKFDPWVMQTNYSYLLYIHFLY